MNEYNTRIFSPERSQSMSILSPQKGQPRMTHLESLEAKMASIEVSLCSTNTPRRKKGTSLGGSTISPRPSLSTDSARTECDSALHERESIIQSLRLQLGLGKQLRPGLPLDDIEVSKAEQELQKLRNDADKKRTVIRNLKTTLESLDIEDNNIDVRIRQAEIEYALGREELLLLSLMEEIRGLQFRLDKTMKSDHSSLYFQLKNGVNMSLYAINSNLARIGMNIKEEDSGIYMDNDRIIEFNGKSIQSKEEIQKLVDSSGRCQLVVIRKECFKQNNQLLLQSQENLRLQHRIQYLEDQVKDLNQILNHNNKRIMKGDHVTSIQIKSSKDNDRPQVFQRGNFVATIVEGKAIQSTSHSDSKDLRSPSANSNQNMIYRNTQYIGSNNKIFAIDKHRDHKKSGYSSDLRNARSLEFQEESFPKYSTTSSICRKPREIDYTSEPVATPLSSSTLRTRNVRPAPPKKPLRLSLQRTRSLQLLEQNTAATIIDLERKRALKRTHRDGEPNLLYTASSHQLRKNKNE